jgi:hypothetical protein
MKKFNQLIILSISILAIECINSTNLSFAETGVISVESFDVRYDIENGKIETIYLNPELDQLTVIMNTQADGNFQISIPRTILDAKFESKDDAFLTLVDNFETSIIEVDSNSTHRTLAIPFFKGDSIVEIIGTQTLNPSLSPSEIKIPSWIKNNAGWWSQDLIADTEFVSGIQYLISNGIIQV